GALGEPGAVADPRDGTAASEGVGRAPRGAVGERDTSGGRLMMRSLHAPAAAGGPELRAAVAAAVPAALAEASVFCLPLHTVVTSGAGATIPLAVVMVVLLGALSVAAAGG